MQILFYSPDNKPEPWLAGLAQALPEASLQVWQDGMTATDVQPADYIVAWKPPAAMLAGHPGLKAIFNLGAGVDAILQLGDALPPNVPLVRLDDAGMAVQMAEYATYAILRHFRRFDDFELQAQQQQWGFLKPNDKADFSVGILGLGVLGSRIAAAVQHFGFPLRGWSRSRKDLPGVACFAGDGELDEFLSGTRILVCVLPLTAETTHILNRSTLEKLPKGAYLINIARGAHVAESDLLALIKSGHLAGATLDVFRNEPLPRQHPFWQEPRISVTPHISALTLRENSINQIAGKIRALQRGEPIAGIVDQSKGY
ncbi:glyoxylate/hydroxypyruvate reductase A [Herminiimonas sp. CN]|uniref:2-hydroxyacid dehydrogenase n=1 Tax=Herminiimonas sp. CN TaxID=1349818 RepID=UPI0004737D7E|nr:glyoxylate/hydroxypyruvate reductase A [Herminiimonas sp. CN]